MWDNDTSLRNWRGTQQRGDSYELGSSREPVDFPPHGICLQLENAIIFKLKDETEGRTAETLYVETKMHPVSGRVHSVMLLLSFFKVGLF